MSKKRTVIPLADFKGLINPEDLKGAVEAFYKYIRDNTVTHNGVVTRYSIQFN